MSEKSKLGQRQNLFKGKYKKSFGNFKKNPSANLKKSFGKSKKGPTVNIDKSFRQIYKNRFKIGNY